MRVDYYKNLEEICVVIRANTRLQLLMATAALLELYSSKKRKISAIVVASGAPSGVSPDFRGFSDVLEEVSTVHFINKFDLTNKLKNVARGKKIVSIGSSLFPHDVVVFCLKNRMIPQIIATEEGIGTYLGLKGRICHLLKKPSSRNFRNIITYLASAVAGPLFRLKNRRLLFKNGSYDLGFLLFVNDVINRAIRSLGTDSSTQIKGKKFEVIVAIPSDQRLLVHYAQWCSGKSVLVKQHPHFGGDVLHLKPIFDVAKDLIVYTGLLSIEELCVLTGARELLATNSSSLIYGSLVGGVKSVNIANVTPKGWGGKDFFAYYADRVNVTFV